MEQPTTVLTIGGVDPCGAFGVPADLKTFAAHGLHGMCAVSVLTAQNSRRWGGATYTPPSFLADQIDAVLEDYGARAVKTGFLGRVDLIEAVAGRLRHHQVENLVVDPVLVDGRGQPMFGAEVTAAYRELLLPLARIITPNQAEFKLLAGGEKSGPPPPVMLLKGVTVDGRWGDRFDDGTRNLFLETPQLATANISGSGDTLSAALTASLAQGMELLAAVKAAQIFTHQALAQAAAWQLAHGAGPLANFFPPDRA